MIARGEPIALPDLERSEMSDEPSVRVEIAARVVKIDAIIAALIAAQQEARQKLEAWERECQQTDIFNAPLDAKRRAIEGNC